MLIICKLVLKLVASLDQLLHRTFGPFFALELRETFLQGCEHKSPLQWLRLNLYFRAKIVKVNFRNRFCFLLTRRELVFDNRLQCFGNLGKFESAINLAKLTLDYCFDVKSVKHLELTSGELTLISQVQHQEVNRFKCFTVCCVALSRQILSNVNESIEKHCWSDGVTFVTKKLVVQLERFC